MIRFKCNGEPYIDKQIFKEAISGWAKAKGVNPDDVFRGVNKGPHNKLRCKLPLSLVVKGQINTSIFEEAEVVS